MHVSCVNKALFMSKRVLEPDQTISLIGTLPDEVLQLVMRVAPNRAFFYVSRQWCRLAHEARLPWWHSLLNREEHRLLARLDFGAPMSQSEVQQLVDTGRLSQVYLDTMALLWHSARTTAWVKKRVECSLFRIGASLSRTHWHWRDLRISDGGTMNERGTQPCLLQWDGQIYHDYVDLRPVEQFISSLFPVSPCWAPDDGEEMTRRFVYANFNSDDYAQTRRTVLDFAGFEERHCIDRLAPYRTEWMLYSVELGLCGTASLLYEYVHARERDAHGKKHLALVSYKCVRHIQRNSFDNTPYVFGWPATDYTAFCMELHLLKMILERHYDCVVDEMWLLALRSERSAGEYVEYEVPVDAVMLARLERMASAPRV